MDISSTAIQGALMTKKTFQNDTPANSQQNQANSAENLLNPIQIYNEWLKNHKKKNASAQGDDAEVSMNEDGTCSLNFKDTQDEEDYLRYLAERVDGTVRVNGEVIAKLQGGKLIDPTTNKEFAPGAYAARMEEIKAQHKSESTQTSPLKQEESIPSMGMPDDSTYNFSETLNDLNDLDFHTLNHKEQNHEEATTAAVNSL